MIIVRLNGGLGNQMFQYATGRTLAHRLDTQLKLDISQFQHNPDRNYNLGCFSIQEQFVSQQDLDRIQMPILMFFKNPFRLLRKKMSSEPPIIRVMERYFHFDPEIQNLSDNIYLKGYWQSEKYFKEIEEIIRREFSIKIPPDSDNKEFRDRISAVNSVSIHVRRGDYVTNPLTYQTHGVCDVDYYQKAIDETLKAIDKPHFFIFSDDQSWAKSNIILNAPMEYVTHNDSLKNYEDLRLMSTCKHHIIANSSFSWWGAWLNQNPDKIVIAPQKWFNDPTINTNDLIPSTWIRL